MVDNLNATPAGMSHLPIDPGLTLPPAVRAQRDRANALMSQLNGSTAYTPPPPVQPVPAAEPQPTNPTPPPQQLLHPMPGPAVNMQPMLGISQPTNPTPPAFDLTGLQPAQPTPIPQQPVQPQPTPQPPQDYEQMYRSLKGRFDAETQRLREAVQQSVQRNQQLEALLAGLGPTPPMNGNGGTPNDPLADFTEEEREQWGDDMLTMFARVMDRRTRAATAQAMQPFTVQQQHQSRRTILDYLDREVPQWRQVNVMPEFENWALMVDPLSGEIRQTLIQRAFEAGDGPRVALFFRTFTNEASPAPAIPQPGPLVAPVPPVPMAGPQPPASNRIPLQDLAAPTGGGGPAGPPAAPVAKRTYRRSEIMRFFSDKALGLYKTPEQQAQAQAIEIDIFAAQSEGRVVNG